MALKTYKPTSPGQRQLVSVDRSGTPQGRSGQDADRGPEQVRRPQQHRPLTSRNRAGGHKRTYRVIDFKRRKTGVEATVERLEYDPNRTAFIALLKYDDGELSYILAPQRLQAGDRVVSGEQVDVKPGNAMELGRMPVGTIVHNVEMKPGKGGQIARPPVPTPSSSAATREWRSCA